jgi:hypothetical protein
MKRLPFLSMFFALALLLAACGTADTDPGDRTPEATKTLSDPLETPEVNISPEITQEVTLDETIEGTPSATPESGSLEIDETSVGESPVDNPNRVGNMLDFNLRNYEDETIGSVEEIIISLDHESELPIQQNGANQEQQDTPANPGLNLGENEHISYVIVNIGGLLGIGQRQVAIPYEALQLKSGEDDNDYAFYIDISQDDLEALPEVDLDQLEFTTQEWDTNLRTSMENEAEPTVEQFTPTVVSGSSNPVDNPEDDEQAGIQIYALRVSVLLGSEVYDLEVAAPQRSGQSTASPSDDGTPTAETTATVTTEGTVLDREMVAAVIEDIIINPDTAQVEYAILKADENLELGERWIPVPLHAVKIMGADDLLLGVGIEYLVQVDRKRLAEAPNFETDTLPVDGDPTWDAGVRDFWQVQ